MEICLDIEYRHIIFPSHNIIIIFPTSSFPPSDVLVPAGSQVVFSSWLVVKTPLFSHFRGTRCSTGDPACGARLSNDPRWGR
jgi:hypothetical protein